MEINLYIGGYVCGISIKSKRWIEIIRTQYTNFITTQKPDFFVRIETLEGGHDNLIVTFEKKNSSILKFAESLQSFPKFNFFLKTIFSAYLLEHDGLVLHASAILYKGNAILFSGKEGSGKSTISQMASSYTILNDDFAIIRKIDNFYYVFSSPFYETNQFPKQRIQVPLGKIFFIQQSKTNEVLSAPQGEIVSMITQLTLTPLTFIPQMWRNFPHSYPNDIGLKMMKMATELSHFEGFSVLRFSKDKSFLSLLP